MYIYPLRTKIAIVVFLISLLLVAVFVTYSGYGAHNSYSRVTSVEPLYVANFNDDKILVGASHNIFVGRVLQQVGSKDLGLGPETQFQVAVLENLKGNLNGVVTVDQIGGLKDGVLHVVASESPITDQVSHYLLEPGSMYIFATRYNKDQDWYTLNSYPTASKKLSSDSNVSEEGLKALTDSDKRVQDLKAAYPHEILLDADIAHNNTLNSYVSVQEAQAKAAAEQPPEPSARETPAGTEPTPSSPDTSEPLQSGQ